MGLLGGLFGKKKKKAGLVDIIGGDGQPIGQVPGYEEPKPTRWMDGGDFKGKDAIGMILGAVGDGLATNNGGQAMAGPMLMKRLQENREAQRKAEEKAAESERLRTVLAGLGRPPQEVEAIVAGAGQYLPKEPERPAFERNFEAWQSKTPEERAGIAAMQRDLNPPQMGGFTGWDGQRYGGGAAIPDGWEPVSPEEEAALRRRQGGAGSGQPGFRRR